VCGVTYLRLKLPAGLNLNDISRFSAWALLILLLLSCTAQSRTTARIREGAATDHVIAGFRASRVLSNYPDGLFPNAGYWTSVGRQMAGRFTGAVPGGIWIEGLYAGNGATELSFPSPGRSYAHVMFSDLDYNEIHLNEFDNAGLRVWLQVEPGAADVDSLIELVLQRYKHHTCVAGFGIDAEWYDPEASSGGRRITDAEARQWELHVKSINPAYSLFLKHWDGDWMPRTYRGSIIFVADSQGFSSLNEMVGVFSEWGKPFAPNDVAFQFGYEPDSSWWTRLVDPPKAIGDAISSSVGNAKGLFWVDFTITQVFPLPTAGVVTTVAVTAETTHTTSTQMPATIEESRIEVPQEVTLVLLLVVAVLVGLFVVLMFRRFVSAGKS